MPSPSWSGEDNTAISLGKKGRAVTPGSTDLDPYAKGIFMLTSGDITFVPVGNDAADTLTASLSAGAVIPYQVRRVTACTGTCSTID